ncbi:diguanylate cyclase domain-containing protein [Almyronema epifaneia]|uniref:Diguanylate cyclase domain-containing protein n=1 Tax=Almyronema epifaneia S1 TaxID=2991925 RepID=A0ABW6IHA9_9CYAN
MTTVLVVDDDSVIRFLLKRTLQQEDFEVLEAANGSDCLTICNSFPVDLVLLDALLPEMNGFDCCARLQQDLAEACPPILMITGLSDRDSVDRAFDVGATDYVTKPIHIAVLRRRVKHILQERWMVTELRHQLAESQLLRHQLETVNHQLMRLANLDSLTQLANRRYFDQTLQQEWRRLTREQKPLGLLLCDVDCFKAYNDAYGHLAGDACLAKIAQVLGENIRRAADLAARYGGEEFVILLPNTDLAGGLVVAENIRQQVEQQHIPHCGSPVQPVVTLSIGVACLMPSHDTEPENLIGRADQALYLAKFRGRNRVISYEAAEAAKRLWKSES